MMKKRQPTAVPQPQTAEATPDPTRPASQAIGDATPVALPGMEQGAAKGRDKGGKKQRMAGEVWRDYDASSNGGASFDNKDLKHLVDQGWSNNDIMKAAVASGHVKAGADRQLRLLGTKESKYSPFKQDGFKPPREVFWSSFDTFGDGASDTDSLMNRVRFLGGDPDKKKNWIVAATDRDKASAQSPDYYGSLGNDAGMSWYRPGTKYLDDKGKAQEVFSWGGVDADGRGQALRGIELKGEGRNFNRQNRSTSWSLPKDFVAERDQAAFAEQMDAHKAANPDPKPTTPTAPASKPAPFDPSKFRGQIDGLMAAVNGLQSSGSSGSEGSGASSGGGGSGDSDYTVQPVAPVAPVGSGGDVLGGFESIINKRYGRPNNWAGDVWST